MDKLAFVHIPKNAGGSIQLAFGLGSNGHAAWDKVPAAELSFAVIRNTWDRFVSCYTFAKQRENTHHGKYNQNGIHPDYDLIKDLTFDMVVYLYYTKPEIFKHEGWKPQHEFICEEEKIKVDRLIRFESMRIDLRELCKAVKIAMPKLPKHNPSDRKNYKRYYNETTRNMIAEAYKKDIEIFNFNF